MSIWGKSRNKSLTEERGLACERYWNRGREGKTAGEKARRCAGETVSTEIEQDFGSEGGRKQPEGSKKI